MFDRQPDLCNGVICHPSNLLGIPLTEEILLKCGFKLRTNRQGITMASIVMENIQYDSLFTLDIKSGVWFYKNDHIKIESLHKLQNVFFLMRDIELEILWT